MGSAELLEVGGEVIAMGMKVFYGVSYTLESERHGGDGVPGRAEWVRVGVGTKVCEWKIS
jgi:hypothetical protein